MRLEIPLSLRQTLGAVVQGRSDPCALWEGERLWLAMRVPAGTVTISLEVLGDELFARAWGEAAGDALDHLEELAGLHYEAGPFEHPHIEEMRRQRRGLRVPRTRAIFDTVVWTVLAQRVTGMEAKASWRTLTRLSGEAAPAGPGTPQLLLPPSAAFLAGLPHHVFHAHGVDRHRTQTIRLAANCARRIMETGSMPMSEARQRLLSLPGIGDWTVNEVAMFALGDSDAVSVGDFHLANQVGWALAGKPRSTDEEMLELLEPFRGRRGEVTRLIVSAHPRPPAYGPRYSPLRISAM